MNKQTEAMKLALEALDGTEALLLSMGLTHLIVYGDTEKAITAIREALAEQPAKDQCRTDGRCQYAIDSGAEGMGHCPKGKCVMPAQPQQEPVAWWNPTKDSVSTDPVHRHNKDCQPLYTSPPASKPLTHEQRVDLLTKFETHKHEWHAPAILIDMVEAAHGIKE